MANLYNLGDDVQISNFDIRDRNNLSSRVCTVTTATEPDKYTVTTKQLFDGQPKTISVTDNDIKKLS